MPTPATSVRPSRVGPASPGASRRCPCGAAPAGDNVAVTTAPRQCWAALALPLLSVAALRCSPSSLDLRTPYGDSGLEFAPEPGWIYAANGVVLSGFALVILRSATPITASAGRWPGSVCSGRWTGCPSPTSASASPPTRRWPGMTFALWFLLRFTVVPPGGDRGAAADLPRPAASCPAGGEPPARSAWRLMCLACVAVIVAPSDDPGDVPRPARCRPRPDQHPGARRHLRGTARRCSPALGVAAFLVTMASVVVRHRRARGVERDQMRWLLWAVHRDGPRPRRRHRLRRSRGSSC